MAVTRTPPRKTAKNAEMDHKDEKQLPFEIDMGLEISIAGPHVLVTTSNIKRIGAKMLEVAIADSSIETLSIKNSSFENSFDILRLIEAGLHNPKLTIEFENSISSEQVREEKFRLPLLHLTEKMQDRIRFDIPTLNIVNITNAMDRVYHSPQMSGRVLSGRLFERKPQEKTVTLPPVKPNTGVELKDDHSAVDRSPLPFVKVSTAKRGRYEDRPVLGSINAPVPVKKSR